MAKPRLKYVEVTEWTRQEVEAALQEDRPESLLRAVIAVSMYDEDQAYAESLCVRLSKHRHFNVRGNAVLGFGHIARVHRYLDKELVHPIVRAALADADEYVRGQAQSAKDDTAFFLKWKYEE
jgi:hypothetical protein